MEYLQVENTLADVAKFLSPPDLVMLGCTCKEFERKACVLLALKMSSYREPIESALTTVLLADQPDDIDCHTKEEAKAERFACIVQMALHRLMLDVMSASLRKFGRELSSLYFPVGGSGQGGLVYLSCLHVAAAAGDLQLCRVLLARGAMPNSNIFIPNDQGSQDDSARASNRDDGSDWSQYRWGLITPMRLADAFSHNDVCQLLQQNGGILGKEVMACKAQLECKNGTIHAMLGCPSLPFLCDNACWVSEDRTELMFKNTYMHGDRVYPDILFTSDLYSSVWELLSKNENVFFEAERHMNINPDELETQEQIQSS